MEVARLARRFPVILELLAEGAVNLTALKLLGPHLTAENHSEALKAARGRSKARIQELVASLAPRPDVPCLVRRLPVPPPAAGPSAADIIPSTTPSITDAGTSLASALPSPIPRASVMPLSPERYKFQVTIGAETLEKMRLAKDMLAHAIPSGDDAVILDRAYSALLAELARKKFGHTSKATRSSRITSGDVAGAEASEEPAPPLASGPSTPGQGNESAAIRKPPPRVPCAAIKRAVWLRDLGRCAFVGTGGHRCTERSFVESHHVDPYALGGEATVDGIQLRCRRHNDYEGRLYFRLRRPGRELVPEQVRLSGSHST